MRSTLIACAAVLGVLVFGHVSGQDLGPNFTKLVDGVYVYLGDPRNKFDTEHDSNAGIIISNDGVLLVDTGNKGTDARNIQAALKKLTTQPVKYIVLTEPHPDHQIGSFLFSPPAVVITHGPTPVSGIESMKADADRIKASVERTRATNPVERNALEGYRHVVAQREFAGHKETIQMGERTIELIYHPNLHSEADISVWLPKERVLFSGAAALVEQHNVFRPFVNIPDILDAIKELRALNPAFVIPSHGAAGVPGTTRLFDESERYYTLLVERVGQLVKEGKSLEQVQKELKIPEFSHWGSKVRMPFGVEAAYHVAKGIKRPSFKVGNSCSYNAPPCMNDYK
jgi:glyoxylase-like metal-dependent hydrolase (beta-lactamase superfamily II)